MIETKVDLTEINRWADKAPRLVQVEVKRAFYESFAALEAEIKENTAVATGTSRRAITHEGPDIRDGSFEGAVISQQPHVDPYEQGQRPHFPPLYRLLNWVQVLQRRGDLKAPTGRAAHFQGDDGCFLR